MFGTPLNKTTTHRLTCGSVKTTSTHLATWSQDSLSLREAVCIKLATCSSVIIPAACACFTHSSGSFRITSLFVLPLSSELPCSRISVAHITGYQIPVPARYGRGTPLPYRLTGVLWGIISARSKFPLFDSYKLASDNNQGDREVIRVKISHESWEDDFH